MLGTICPPTTMLDTNLLSSHDDVGDNLSSSSHDDVGHEFVLPRRCWTRICPPTTMIIVASGLRCIDFGVSKTSRCIGASEGDQSDIWSGSLVRIVWKPFTNTGRPKRADLIGRSGATSERHRSDWFSIHRASKHRNPNPITPQP